MYKIDLPASKSISNRALILRALSSYDIQLENLADCDDTRVLQDALQKITSLPSAFCPSTKARGEGLGERLLKGEANIGACGTAMRFLTAYFAVTPGEYFLTGSERMQQRPIKILVDALRSLGADIKYTGKEGYPPLLIKGKKLEGGRLHIDGSVSSQYISALLMVGAFMPNGLQLKLTGKVVSKPYIEMTKALIKEFQVPGFSKFKVESDWSAASYWYEFFLLSQKYNSASLPQGGPGWTLQGLQEKSLQGDSIVKYIFSLLGIKTTFTSDGALITQNSKPKTQNSSLKTQNSSLKTQNSKLKFDFSTCPDLVQTLVCTCLGMGIAFEFTGVETLRIKETDRLEALRQECRKLGARLQIKDNSHTLAWDGTLLPPSSYDIATYNDHRMAMSFAPLRLKYPLLRVDDESVVTKSYPNYFTQLRMLKSANS